VSGRLRSNHREPAPGHGPAKKHLVQWRERSHGRGNSRPHPCGRSKDRRPTSDRDSPRRSTDMREPANKRLITVVSRLAPTVARSSHNNFSRVFGEGGLWLRRRLDNGHKRMRSVGLSSSARSDCGDPAWICRTELAAAATAISGRRYSVAECCDFALLQLATAEQIFLANEARLMHKRASFRTVIKARCGLLRRAFVLGV
jgi:hypothetical protein